MSGYRIRIEPDDFRGEAAEHYSGSGSVRKAARVACPNCGRELFPVLSLSFRDERLRALGIWSRPSATVLVCAACALYMEPYFVHHEPTLAVSGGERDGGHILQNVDQPYACRLIALEPLPGSDPDAPRHQVGGPPPKPIPNRACPTCSQSMRFFGCVVYDGLNVPLYENGGTPVALIIGDGDYLALSACASCAVIGAEWVHG